MTYKVRYSSIDRFRETRSYKTLEGARKYAANRVGDNPDMGSHYAVSFDGIGKITVEGCTLQELFYGETKPAGAYEVWIGCVNEDRPSMGFYKDKSFATLAEANARANEVDEEGVDGIKLIGTTDEAKAAIAAQDAAYAAQFNQAYDYGFDEIPIPDPYKAYRLAGCVCSEMQLSHVGCECEATNITTKADDWVEMCHLADREKERSE